MVKTMEQTDLTAALVQHQRAAHVLLKQGAEAVSAGVAPTLAALPALRAEMAGVLNAYQTFKHDGIFNPAVASGDAERTTLGRAMKIECIAAGEVFRTHLSRWKAADIGADWDNYVIAMRLAAGQLRRHIDNERAGILRLIELAAADHVRH
jgi:hypothetical protein